MYGCFFLFYSSHLSIYLKVNLVFWLYVKYCWGFPGGSDGNESTCNAGDSGWIPGSGRSPEEGNGNPLQYSCLENSMDRGAWWAAVHGVAQSGTRLKQFSMHACIGEGNGNPLLPGESQGQRSLWAAVYGVVQSQT